MALIRALGYHVTSINFETGPDEFYEQLYGLSSKIDNLRKGFDCEVWTRRVVLPQLPGVDPRLLSRYVELAELAARDIGVDFIAFPFSDIKLNKYRSAFAEILKDNKNIVSSVKIAGLGEVPTYTEVASAVNALFELAETAGPEACTRFALACGDQPETAYFPDAASRREGFSITLRYVPDLMESIANGSIENLTTSLLKIFKHFEISAKRASKSAEVPYLGTDTSLSPWMEESVARLVSKMLGDEFGSPGTYDAVNRLNVALERANSEINALGFGEVMLSVAEDNMLKELCGAGKIGLQHLVSMIQMCVAGLDMVAIPLSTSRERLARLLMDVLAIAHRKRRPVGVRLLLVPSNPNSYVEIGRFGRVPVLQV
jgi:uncharacterized protein (UPF0210 family)